MSTIALFEKKQVRRVWNQVEEKWYFAIVDVVAVLTDSNNPQVYWRVMKKRLTDEGSESVTKCNALKMTAADGKQRLTDVADTEQLFRLIQSIPSPKAEPFKRWLAQVGYERLEEIENPELAAKRMRAIYEQKGYSEAWIEKRMRGIAVRTVTPEENSRAQIVQGLKLSLKISNAQGKRDLSLFNERNEAPSAQAQHRSRTPSRHSAFLEHPQNQLLHHRNCRVAAGDVNGIHNIARKFKLQRHLKTLIPFEQRCQSSATPTAHSSFHIKFRPTPADVLPPHIKFA